MTKEASSIRSERLRISERLKAEPYKTRRHLKALEATRLFENGWTNDEIAKALDVSDGREVRRLRSEAERDSVDGPDPKHGPYTEAWLVWREHSKECRECWDDDFTGHDHLVDDAVEGYAKFFEAYNREGFKITPHARVWVWEAMRHIRLLLNVPPRHAKSTYMSVWIPIFLTAADRNAQTLIISQTGDFAKKFCRAIATEMSDNVKLIDSYGRFVPTDSKKTWSPSQGELKVEGSTTGDRTIQVRGAKQQVLGMEADWITCDDPDDPDIARSVTERLRLRNWYKEQVISRGAPGCHVTVIGQRVGINDLYGWLASKTATAIENEPHVYKHILTPAILDWEKQEVLWPELWPFDRLIKERYSDDSSTFETMYQQNPQTEGMTIFDPAWINGDDSHPGCLDTGRVAGDGMVTEDEMRSLPVVRVLSLDPSPTQYSAFIVADVIHNYTEFHAAIIHVESEKIHGREILNHLDLLISTYNPDYLIIEDSAVSKWIFQDPWYEKAKYRVHVRAHNTNAGNKGDPEWGVQSLAIDFENGRIRLPWGDAEGRIMSNSLLSEMYAYDALDKGRDDCIMALWFIRFSHRSLVPKLQFEGGFDSPKYSTSPVVKRALMKKDTDEEIMAWYRKQKGGRRV